MYPVRLITHIIMPMHNTLQVSTWSCACTLTYFPNFFFMYESLGSTSLATNTCWVLVLFAMAEMCLVTSSIEGRQRSRVTVASGMSSRHWLDSMKDFVPSAWSHAFSCRHTHQREDTETKAVQHLLLVLDKDPVMAVTWSAVTSAY